MDVNKILDQAKGLQSKKIRNNFGGKLTIRISLALLLCLSVFSSRITLATSKSDTELTQLDVECVAVDLANVSSLKGLRVSAIHAKPANLFNLDLPDENKFVHKIANTLHITTRESTIIDAMPLKVGDVLEEDSLLIAERVLRSRRYLHSASVIPVKRCGESVEIRVNTIDNWTLTPAISLSSKGGEERFKFELQDLNLLGYGKNLTYRHHKSAEDELVQLVYADANLLGSQHRLSVQLGNTDTGDANEFYVGLPFVSGSTDRSWWFRAGRRSDGFDRSQITSLVQPETETNLTGDEKAIVDVIKADVGIAKRINNSSSDISRIGIGVRFHKQETTDELANSLGDTTDHKELYPYAFFRWANNSWTKRQNFLALGTIEDINSGLGFRGELGLVLSAFGNDSDALRVATTVSKGLWTSDNSLHRFALDNFVYLGRDKIDRYAIGARYHYFRWLTEDNHVELNIVLDQQRGRSANDNMKVGGEYGLKGYRNAYQQGDTRAIGTLEVRHITDWTMFSLVNVGWGVFAEVGGAWNGSINEDREALADVGAGFMFSPTRGTTPELIRLDITFPLVDGEGVDEWLLYAGTQVIF